MANNYPYYTPPYYQPYRYPGVEQPQPAIKGKPVASIDEVRATTIDFDGSVFYFPDLANKRIYTKQINFDGTNTINTYQLIATPNNSNEKYVTREEFESLIARLGQSAGTQVQSAPQQAQQNVEAAVPASSTTSAAPRQQFNF